jgi:hypothetical protein
MLIEEVGDVDSRSFFLKKTPCHSAPPLLRGVIFLGKKTAQFHPFDQFNKFHPFDQFNQFFQT